MVTSRATECGWKRRLMMKAMRLLACWLLASWLLAEDAMRGILEAGGNITEDWTVERVVEVGDRATGTTVLADLYRQMKATAVDTDLDALWRGLGVQVKNGAVTFDDRAPLAE